MHLRYDNKFNALIFISCLLFIGVFFTYTMNDTDHRGELDPDQNMKVLESTGENAPAASSRTPPIQRSTPARSARRTTRPAARARARARRRRRRLRRPRITDRANPRIDQQGECELVLAFMRNVVK